MTKSFSIAKGKDLFIFRYDNYFQILDAIKELVTDPTINFDSFDSLIATKEVLDAMKKDEQFNQGTI